MAVAKFMVLTPTVKKANQAKRPSQVIARQVRRMAGMKVLGLLAPASSDANIVLMRP